MNRLLRIIKKIFTPKTRRPLTPEEKQAIDEQVIIVDSITRE